MWNKKSTAVILAGLLLFALLVSGGCLGDGDNSSDKFQKMALIGKVTDEDVETLKEDNIELVDYSKENLQKTRAVLISKIDNLTDEQKADIKEMFDENKEAVVSIYEPASAEKITALKTMVLGAKNTDNAIIKEDSLGLKKDGTKDENARVRLYSILKDAKGNTHSLAGIVYNTKAKFDALQQNDNIRQVDIDDPNIVWVKYDKETGKYNVLNYERTPQIAKEKASGSEEVKEKILFYSVKEEPLGQVAESDITIGDDNIKVNFNGSIKQCLSVEKENELYLLLRENIELPSGEATRVEKIAADGEDTSKTDEPTEKEKMLIANKESLKQFVTWLREKKLTTEELLADAGYIKPKTRFEKFVAWAKDLLGSTGLAFADDEDAPNLYEIAHTYTGQLYHAYANLPGLSMAINNYVISLHAFDYSGKPQAQGSDIYYVTEKCVFTNALDSYYKRHWYEHGSYESRISRAFLRVIGLTYWPNGAECDEGYFSEYKVRTALNCAGCAVACHWSQPDTYNNVTTTSVTHGWNIGGSVNAGVEAGGDSKAKLKVGLALTGGYNSSTTEEYETQDIEAIEYDSSNTDGSKTAEITIHHIVNKIPERDSTWYKLTYPAKLATSSYNPVHTFIWEMKTVDRDKYKGGGYHIDCYACICGAYSHNSGSLKPEYYKGLLYYYGNIALPMPPLFCLDKDIVNFDDGEKKTDHIVIYSQGKWEIADKDSVPSWLVLTENAKQLTIEVKPNETGKTREAYVTVRRVGGTDDFDERVIYITQSMYSK